MQQYTMQFASSRKERKRERERERVQSNGLDWSSLEQRHSDHTKGYILILFPPTRRQKAKDASFSTSFLLCH